MPSLVKEPKQDVEPENKSIAALKRERAASGATGVKVSLADRQYATERSHMEKALRESEERFKSLFG